MTKPTFVFIHGAWHPREYFDRVISTLEPLGYKCIAPSLPSVGREPPTTSLDEDIATVRSTVIQELDNGNDVIINAHSWGGIPTTTALDGLSKEKRASEGKTTGVLKLTFVSAFILPKGLSLETKIGGPSWWWIIDDKKTVWAEDFTPIMYHDIDPRDAKLWCSKLKLQSYAALTDVARSPAYKNIPSAYLVCEDDRAIPVEGQDNMIEEARKDGAVIEVERLFVAHSPYLNKPDAVAAFLRRAAGEEVK